MDFMWPAVHRDSRETAEALALASALTALAAFVVAAPLGHTRPPPVMVQRAATRVEQVTFVTPPTPVRPQPVEMPRPTAAAPAIRTTPEATTRERDASPAAGAPGVANGRAEPPATDTAQVTPPAAGKPKPVAGPVIAPLGYSRPAGPLVMRFVPGGSTLNGWRLVPKDEQAGLVSDERRRYEEARQIQPADVAARGGMASITTGWLGRGPTREERARDRAIHAGNLERLAALAARAQARLDSLRVADSLARLARPPIH